MCICRVVKCFAFSVTGFGQICARWRAVVVNYNKSTNCANMPKTVRLKCSTGVGYGYSLFFRSMRSIDGRFTDRSLFRPTELPSRAEFEMVFYDTQIHTAVKAGTNICRDLAVVVQ